MTTTNDELKDIILEQGGETKDRLLSIETHLATLNGKVAAQEMRQAKQEKQLEELPCVERGETLAKMEALVEASMSPREQGRLEAQVEAQPTAREMGRLEERQEVHKTNWKLVVTIALIPVSMFITALVTILLTGTAP